MVGLRSGRLSQVAPRGAGLIELDLGSQDVGQGRVVLTGRQIQCLLGGLDGLGEAARLGVGGGQGAQHGRFFSCGKLHRAIGQLDGRRGVAYRRGRTGSEHPRHLIKCRNIVRLQEDQLVPLANGVGDSSLPVERVAQMVTGPRVVGLDHESLLKLGGGFVEPPGFDENMTQIAVRVGVIRLEFRRGAELSDGLVELIAGGQNQSVIVVEFGRRRVDFQGPAEMRDGLVESATPGEDIAEIAMGFRVVGRDFQRLS